MHIYGFQRLTLLDYPGLLACTIFLGHCNFRCPFCQNGNILLYPKRELEISEEEVMAHLKKRRGILEGVCVTGGEATLDPDLPEFLRRIKALGYQVKLDTNGYRPNILKRMASEGVLDYVAMDIKNAPDRYGETVGVKGLDVLKIQHSVEFLIGGTINYEFRTTVMRELHGWEEFKQIGNWLAGCQRYYLQNYRESESVITPVFSGYSKEQLERFRELLMRSIPEVGIRGVE
ncbi:MAG: anaerobic ribonucleoside-triphosphate reductase activating protein [Lachnospiraceae bacterium]|nr:anaerobic ribonucleoside-triphosphate reductase activating protein [Lachnospiraceae bacterium]